MKEFVSIKPAKDKISKSRLDEFVDIFNKKLNKGETTANTGIDFIPYLNHSEFTEAVIQAAKNGYILTSSPDNYQTTTYKLEEIT